MENPRVWQVISQVNDTFIVLLNGASYWSPQDKIAEALDIVKEEYQPGDFLSVNAWLKS